MHNTTFITAFYDIGRNNWSNYKRTVNDYISYFSKIASMEANMVIFCDEKNKLEIQKIRPESEITQIITKKFEELEYVQKYLKLVSNVMNSEEFKKNIIFSDIPEMLYPEYNIINFNKISFVQDSISKFDTKTYGWIDFGYGHGKVDIKVTPDFCESVTKDDKIYMSCLKKPQENTLYNRPSYFNNDVCITGSSFIGTKKSICEFKSLMEQVIEKSLEMNLTDDDQTMYNMCYLINKNLFNLKQGPWFCHFNK